MLYFLIILFRVNSAKLFSGLSAFRSLLFSVQIFKSAKLHFPIPFSIRKDWFFGSILFRCFEIFRSDIQIRQNSFSISVFNPQRLVKIPFTFFSKLQFIKSKFLSLALFFALNTTSGLWLVRELKVLIFRLNT